MLTEGEQWLPDDCSPLGGLVVPQKREDVPGDAEGAAVGRARARIMRPSCCADGRGSHRWR